MDRDPDEIERSPRTDPETLVRDVASLFNTYVGPGVRINSFVEEANPNLNIEGVEDLLNLYFVLTEERTDVDVVSGVAPGVLTFVDRLPERIRRLKTELGREKVVTGDAIRGPISWSETVSVRSQRARTATGTFVVEETTKEIDLPENRVLKRLLTVISDIVDREIELPGHLTDRRQWASEWTQNTYRREIVREALEENPFLASVSTGEGELPYRELERAASARADLYRRAAELLGRYRRLQRVDVYPEEAKQLFRRFFLTPGGQGGVMDGTSDLFELYWAFKLLPDVDTLRLVQLDSANFTGEVARWRSGGGEYKLYHDAWKPGRITFEDDDSNIPAKALGNENNDYFSQRRRYTRAIRQLNDGIDEPHNSRGVKFRPDIVIVRRDFESDVITNVFIGEVKYTRSRTTIINGLDRFLETVAHAQLPGGDYLAATGELWDDERLEGGFFVDKSPLPLERYPDWLTICEYGDNPEIPF